MFDNHLSRQRKKTRRALMDATIRLIIAHGYDQLTVTAITKEADYGRRTFYQFFKDKEDIVQTILIEWFLEFNEEMWKRIADLPSPQREYTLWRFGVLIVKRNINFFRQLPDLYQGEEGARLREKKYQVIYSDIVKGKIQLREGITPELLVNMELLMIGLMIAEFKETGDVARVIQIVDDHFRIIFNQDPPDVNI